MSPQACFGCRVTLLSGCFSEIRKLSVPPRGCTHRRADVNNQRCITCLLLTSHGGQDALLCRPQKKIVLLGQTGESRSEPDRLGEEWLDCCPRPTRLVSLVLQILSGTIPHCLTMLLCMLFQMPAAQPCSAMASV